MTKSRVGLKLPFSKLYSVRQEGDTIKSSPIVKFISKERETLGEEEGKIMR